VAADGVSREIDIVFILRKRSLVSVCFGSPRVKPGGAPKPPDLLCRSGGFRADCNEPNAAQRRMCSLG
jgi:hypothetical protein